MKYPAGDTLVDVYETLKTFKKKKLPNRNIYKNREMNKIKTDINTNDKFYTCRNDRTFKEVLLNEKRR